MKTEPIPANWDSLLASSPPYWRGMDILERHWERTKAFANHEPASDDFQEYMFWRRVSVIWACSTIEAFVNEEGVAWLGESFYKDNLERLRVLQKIRTIYALKYRNRLPRNLPRLKYVEKLFELRNAIVHPKAREGPESILSENNSIRNLHEMEFLHLRKVFWTVTALFEPEGCGENEGETTDKNNNADDSKVDMNYNDGGTQPEDYKLK